MAEPTTTTAAGVTSLAVLFASLLGPDYGPYVLIALSAISGSLWPLSASSTSTCAEGVWLILRCTLTALICTGVLAGLMSNQFGIPINDGLAPVAMLIGACGNGWRPVFDGLGELVRSFIPTLGKERSK